MLQEISLTGPNKDFESIKKIDENGFEYWTARELMPVLGYLQWKNFEIVIKKAQQACTNSKQFPLDHFADISKMVSIGSSTVRKVKDYKLSRYACYLIAQNGDPDKRQIAMAQTYFATQTRKQEISQKLSSDEKRIALRKDVSDKNKKLFSTAKLSGVSNFGKFNDAGYKGLYTMPLSEVEKKKGVTKGQLLDHSGSEELGANIFRITQTEAKLKREGIRGDIEAQRTHFGVGQKVRNAIKEIGGELPENLKPEKHIKELKKEKKIGNKTQKKIK